MKQPRALAAIVIAAACAWSAGARAEVWGWVDDKGVAHFAAEQVDERYQLFYRGGQDFDTAAGIATPRSVPVPTSSSRKLLAFFDISPGFKQVKHHIREASREHGIEFELLQALIATESGFDPQAVSPKGAVGLMQIMPATAQRYGVAADAKSPIARKLTDPRLNVRTGARYLRDLIAMFPGNIELALAAYNAGEGAVQRAGNRIPNYRETQNYVKTVMQLYAMLKPPAMGLPTPANGQAPNRVRMQIPGARRNLPLSVSTPAGVASDHAPPASD